MTVQHAHQYDTNGDRYRCPVPGCWWKPTGVQAMPGPGRRVTCRTCGNVINTRSWTMCCGAPS